MPTALSARCALLGALALANIQGEVGFLANRATLRLIPLHLRNGVVTVRSLRAFLSHAPGGGLNPLAASFLALTRGHWLGAGPRSNGERYAFVADANGSDRSLTSFKPGSELNEPLRDLRHEPGLEEDAEQRPGDDEILS
jgi:hypothetical protein